MALEDTAVRLIRKFGEEREVTLKQPNATPADPDQPFDVDPTSAETSLTVNAVVLRIRRNLVDGKSVRQGDELALIAGPSFGTIVPTTADKLFDAGIDKNIVDVERVRPGKTDFLWKLQIRAA